MKLIIVKFHRATHIPLNQNESYRQSPEKTKNNGEHKKTDNINT